MVLPLLLDKSISQLCRRVYPEYSDAGLTFAYQLLYLLDATGFYSLGLHALDVHVCRATGQELV